MTFTFADIPLASNLISNSQGDIRDNFDYLQAILNTDHQSVFGNNNTTAFEGRHQQVSLLDWNVVTPGSGPVFPVGQNVDNQIFSYQGNLFAQTATKEYQITPSLAIQAACRFQGTTIVGNSINISGITGSNGNYLVSFTNPITTNYIPVVTVGSSGGAFAININAPGTTSIRVISYSFNAGAIADAANYYLVIYNAI